MANTCGCISWCSSSTMSQIKWDGAVDWFCLAGTSTLSAADYKFKMVASGSTQWGTGYGNFDAVSNGGSWYYCDADGDGESGPNGVKMGNKEKIKFAVYTGGVPSWHDYVCMQNTKYAAESIIECCGAGAPGVCYSTGSSGGIRLQPNENIYGWLCLSKSNSARGYDGILTYCPAPSAEICDNNDNDCDGDIDEGCDDDKDGYADNSITCSGSFMDGNGAVRACSTNSGDCADTNPNINPGKPDICDGIDNDCKDSTADGSGVTAALCPIQLGVCAGSRNSCESGAWQCNYTKIASYQTVETICTDGLDNDCDILIDNGDPDCDLSAPEIEEFRHAPLSPKVLEQISISVNATDLQSGLKNITIYVDGQIVNNCTIAPISPCNVSLSYVRARTYSYSITVYDNTGNVNRSETKNFTVISDTEKNCSENTNNTGTLCKSGEYCIWGIFVNTSDGSGANAGTSEPGDAKCCDGTYCSLSAVLPFCILPTGTEYNISIASCPGNIITNLVQVSIPGLECCDVTPKLTMEGFDVYWSRQTSGYSQLTEASEGDYLYCIATNAIETVTFEIEKPGKPEPPKQVPAETGITYYSVLADETGTFTCNATDSSGNSAVATIKVTEAEKSAVALPFFGFFEFIMALILVIIYQSCRVKIKKGVNVKRFGGSG